MSWLLANSPNANVAIILFIDLYTTNGPMDIETIVRSGLMKETGEYGKPNRKDSNSQIVLGTAQ
ncbi:MAG: hypothetical protein M3R50_08135 [Bacteroidota bacterium]|nr:hypothetical protein [Bacteroidota bacterium]